MNRLLSVSLVLISAVALLTPNCESSKPAAVGKSPELYWHETGLSATELEGLLEDQSCYSSQTSFLACVNSLSMMVEKFQLSLQQNGQLQPQEKNKTVMVEVEKAQLKKWESLFSAPEVSMPFSFLQVWKSFRAQYVKPKQLASVVAAGINGFLSVFKDPHTYIVPIAMYEEVIANSESKQDPLGFLFKRYKNQTLVKKVFEGSPAALAGLKKGDELLGINGASVPNLYPQQISEALRRSNEKRVELVVRRRTELLDIDIVKSDTIYPAVNSKVLNGSNKLGVLTIHRFTRDTCSLATKHLTDLKEQGVQGLLLDLRDNPGGQLDEAACVAGLFLKKGTMIFETRYLDRAKPNEIYLAEKAQFYKGSVAVLINSGSASAAEILAGSLKDVGRATLVGEKTFGKGSFQDGHIWGANDKIALFQTEGLYYFPSGWTPQLVGLEPDVPVTFDARFSSGREVELFYNPIKPKDQWAGPQTLAWLNDLNCSVQNLSAREPFVLEDQILNDDNQMQRAKSWMLCNLRLSAPTTNQARQTEARGP